MFMRTMVFAAIFVVGIATGNAQNSCTVESDGRVTMSGNLRNVLQVCRNVPLEGGRYTMRRFGFCAGEPDAGSGFSNCHSLIDEAIEVTFSDGSSQSFSAKLPQPGTYSHYFALIDNVYDYSVILELTNPASSVSGGGIFTTPYNSADLPDCSGGCSGVYEPSSEPETYFLDSDDRFLTPNVRPGAVPLARLETDNLSADPSRLVHSVTTGAPRTLKLMNYKFQIWNGPMDDDDRYDVRYLLMHEPLSNPFEVTGQETEISVDFDLSRGASFVYWQSQEGIWHVQNLMLSNTALTPTISVAD